VEHVENRMNQKKRKKLKGVFTIIVVDSGIVYSWFGCFYLMMFAKISEYVVTR
jgi:hypothetical protein